MKGVQVKNLQIGLCTILVIASFGSSCQAVPEGAMLQCSVDGQQKTAPELADFLTSSSLNRLFGAPVLVEGEWLREIDLIWNSADELECLEKVALEPSTSSRARFLAAEVLLYKYRKRGIYPSETVERKLSPALAPVYVEVLARSNELGFAGNSWAYPREERFRLHGIGEKFSIVWRGGDFPFDSFTNR